MTIELVQIGGGIGIIGKLPVIVGYFNRRDVILSFLRI